MGQFGKKYELRILAREIIEIPMQSYQGYLLSCRWTETWIVSTYGSIIAMDSLLVPVIMGLPNTNVLQRRIYILLLDAIVDTVLSFMSLVTLVPLVYEFVAYPGIQAQLSWATRALSTLQQLLVSDLIGLVSKLTPIFMANFMLNSIGQIWDEGDFTITTFRTSAQNATLSPTPVSTVRRRSLSNIQLSVVNIAKHTDGTIRKNCGLGFKAMTEKILAFPSVIWAITLIVSMYLAPYITTCDHLTFEHFCLAQAHPWMAESNTCHCLAIQFDCHKQKVWMETISTIKRDEDRVLSLQAIDQVLAFEVAHSTPLYLGFRRCSTINQLPKSSELLSELRILGADNCKLRNLGIDLSKFQYLFAISLRWLPLHAFPATLQHIGAPIFQIGLIGCNLTTIPEWVVDSFANVQTLRLTGNKLNHFPLPLLSLTNLRQLELASNNISSIPATISQLQNLHTLRLGNNSITSLPASIKQLPALKFLSLAANNISSIQALPWTSTQIANWPISPDGLLALNQNPICQVISNDLHVACIDNCNALCDDTIHKNYICDEECFDPRCNFDKGICKKFLYETST